MTAPLLDISGLHYRYAGARSDALADLDLTVQEGECVAVVGANGSGKSTLARLLGGLDRPAAARRAGACGHDLLTGDGRHAARRDVGVLFQNPENQLVAEHVEEDIAFGLENLGWASADIRRRVDEMLARFDLEGLRRREPHLLSGGQKQRAALAGVLAIPRRAIVLDEPTAMLDPAGRADVLAAVAALRAEGLAVVYVTQEMDEVVGVDRVVALEGGSEVYAGDVDGLFADGGLVRRLNLGLPVAAEVAQELARRGRPLPVLPLTLDALLAGLGGAVMRGTGKAGRAGAQAATDTATVAAAAAADGAAAGGLVPAGMSLACHGVTFSYEEGREAVPAVRDVGFALAAGGSLALLGASGAGKSTLLQVVRGLDEPEAGAVVLDGVEPGGEGYAALRREVGLVFQIPELQLFAPSAREDVAFGPRRLRWSEERVAEAVSDALELVGLPEEKFGDRHPYALSGGEQRRLALAGVLAMKPRLLLLDEPFVSLDPGTRRQLAEILGRLKDAGVTIVLATHDVDLAWALCDEVLVLSDGAVAASGAWEFGAAATDLLARNRLREPLLVELWRRLGRDLATAPRTAAQAAEALA